ncbi:MAG: S1 RNA-binding domain-containing protein [Phycisphaerae bacterium]|nr:S1 RNA-binding domain-containing protein [Phycisphaerae bacterium]
MSQSPQEKDVLRRQGQAMDEDVQKEIEAALGDMSLEDLLDKEQEAKNAARREAAPAGPATPGLRRGRVLAIESRSVLIDLGGKSQGIIPLEQFEDHVPKVGDTVDGIFDRYDAAEGLVHLSRKGAVAAAAWNTLEEGQIVEGRVTGVNKGGLELEVNGIRAFMPAGQVDIYRIEDISTFIGQRMRCQVTDLDRRDKNLVVSRRGVLELEKEEKREATWKEIEIGQVHEGVIRSIMPYGAFVDLGGVDGLLHISDLAWGRVDKVEDVVQLGQKVQVKVVKLDKDARKISLGLKQMGADPWTTVATRFQPKMTIQGRVTRVVDFGAFVEIEPGIEGLAPVSELGWSRVNHPRDVLTAGQVHTFLVLSVEPDRKRISLSLKQAQANPWTSITGRYSPEMTVPGKVTRVVDFGAFVELEPGVEGLVHVSQMSDKRVNHPSDVVKVGQEVQARVLSVNEQERKISLSLKAPAPAATAAPAGAASAAGGAAAAQAAPPPPPKKKRDKPLKGGLERKDGSMGLGDLKLPGM